MVIDMLVVLAAFFAAFILRQHMHIIYRLDLFPGKQVIGELRDSLKYLNILPLILFTWWASLSASGLYESFRRKNFFELVWGIIKSAFLTMIVIAAAAFILKLDFVSRSFIALLFLISCALLILERFSIVTFLRHMRKKGYNFRNILLVGTGQRAGNFINLVHRHNEWGLRILGLIDVDKDMLDKTIAGKKVIGTLDDIPGILNEKVVDEVMFIVPRSWLSMIEKSLLACEVQGIRTNIAADFFNLNIARSVSSEIEGMPLLSFQTTIGEEWQLLLKRVFDIIMSLAGIILALPIFLALTAMIKFLSPGPAIFKQVRSGLNGRKFVMYKFRTMMEGAEAKKAELEKFNTMKGPVFKMRNDPRVTRFGAFLRRSSMDELPQLVNVLKGEMSIVGPRPPLPSEIDRYEVWQRRRLSMKPGLTCLWQANGRNNVDFEKWMKLDLEYIDNWSLGMDLKIILKTIPAVLFLIGAR
ncbi:MAG: sugar transferase [Candidatus Omnitrophica bacterium]|nr:sugar transferase [Candidatus Omnitrophota bacterium]